MGLRDRSPTAGSRGRAPGLAPRSSKNVGHEAKKTTYVVRTKSIQIDIV